MRILVGFLALILAAVPARAQRALHWRDISVDARLEADGTLRITERQTMVFTGDWNGGERRFDVPFRQRLTFNRMYRMDDAGGTHLMREGDRENIDEYEFVNSTTLRWRSRLPTDPPFDQTAITYVLEYSYANVLQSDDGRWVLDHDFGFASRDGVIENLVVHLELDPAWQATLPDDGTWRGSNLSPGEGFVVSVPLTYAGAGDGPEVNLGAEPVERGIIAAVVLVLIASFGRRLISRERAKGRLEPLPAHDPVDEKWLEEHVFKHLPEAIGAAWDNRTDASEVAAVLARFVNEGRMKSEVKPGGFLSGPELHLELLVERSRFHGYERQLVDALFESGSRITDTDSIRKRYKKSGFNPAEKIRKPLKEIVAGLAPGAAGLPKPSAMPTLLIFVLAVVLMGIAIASEPADGPVVVISAVIILVCYLLALGGSAVWRNRVHNVGPSAAMFLVPWGISVVGLMIILFTGITLASVLALAGVAAFFVALANSLFNQARSRESAERIAFRRQLATARAWFASELNQHEPRMKDEWFPYLIAFGLGKHMDRWFASFGRAYDATTGHSSYSSGSSSGHGGGGWTGFGGGGGFSGGGASASWAAAAGSIASGVSAPSSSSSSSGGGGGGGSSGGGGGGGW